MLYGLGKKTQSLLMMQHRQRVRVGGRGVLLFYLKEKTFPLPSRSPQCSCLLCAIHVVGSMTGRGREISFLGVYETTADRCEVGVNLVALIRR